jgi:hypothetical protein
MYIVPLFNYTVTIRIQEILLLSVRCRRDDIVGADDTECIKYCGCERVIGTLESVRDVFKTYVLHLVELVHGCILVPQLGLWQNPHSCGGCHTISVD